MPFALVLAFRFLVDGRAQTAFIVVGVGVGVAVQVFVSALIDGLQADLIAQTVAVQPQVVVEPATERPRALRTDEVLRSTLPSAQRVRGIDSWQRERARIARHRDVRAVSPRVSGPGLAVHGEASASVTVTGVVADSFDRVVPMASHVVDGRFALDGRETVIGVGLAQDLGVGVGDRVRIETAAGRGELFHVAGLFDLGSKEANARWALVSLRTAQTLFGIPGGATHLDVGVGDVFRADSVARDLRDASGLRAESWMEQNAQLLAALRSQSSSTAMIEAFVLLAVAMGIASVLVVAVVERRGSIGILRAVGATRATVVSIFLLQGAAMGFAGSLLGSLLGSAFAVGFRWAMAGSAGAVHRIVLEPALFLGAMGIATSIGILAAVLPARHAARLDPAVAIRHG